MTNLDDKESVSVVRITSRPHSPGSGRYLARTYVIEAAANDEAFVINGEVFEAKTYCFGFEKGDRVRFVSGSAFGACVSATILNLRNGKTREVWCE